MTAQLLTLDVQFRRNLDKLIPVELQFAELHQLAATIGPWSPLLQHWYLSSSKSKTDALQYEAFAADGPTTAALAVVKEKTKAVTDIRSISLWNGADSDDEAAGMSSQNNVLGRPDAIMFRMAVKPRVSDWKQGAESKPSKTTLLKAHSSMKLGPDGIPPIRAW